MEKEKEKFLVYEDIRINGYTNMFDVREVIDLSDGVLSKADCVYIMKNYSALAKKYL